MSRGGGRCGGGGGGNGGDDSGKGSKNEVIKRVTASERTMMVSLI